jgi:hypothetical protein
MRHIEGKIDTGADVCALPESIIADLDLAPVRTVRAAGFGGVLQEALLFHADLEVAGRRSKHVEALSTRRPYAIIGRKHPSPIHHPTRWPQEHVDRHSAHAAKAA